MRTQMARAADTRRRAPDRTTRRTAREQGRRRRPSSRAELSSASSSAKRITGRGSLSVGASCGAAHTERWCATLASVERCCVGGTNRCLLDDNAGMRSRSCVRRRSLPRSPALAVASRSGQCRCLPMNWCRRHNTGLPMRWRRCVPHRGSRVAVLPSALQKSATSRWRKLWSVELPCFARQNPQVTCHCLTNISEHCPGRLPGCNPYRAAFSEHRRCRRPSRPRPLSFPHGP